MKSFIINMALSFLSGMIQSIGIPNLEEFAVALGRCFGPEGARHWSELSASEQDQWLTKVPILTTPHTDYSIKQFRWIPRTLTTYIPDPTLPFPPPMLAGNNTGFADIPPRGQWVGSRGYIAFTFLNGFHIRGFFRPDLSDKYYSLDVAAKQV